MPSHPAHAPSRALSQAWRLESTSDARSPLRRLRGDGATATATAIGLAEPATLLHAASRRRNAASDPSPTPPAHTRAWLALPRAAAQTTAQGRCIDEASIGMRLPPRRSRPLCAVMLPASPLACRCRRTGFSSRGTAGGASEALRTLVPTPSLHMQARDVRSHTATRAGIHLPVCCRKVCAAL